MLQRLYVRVRSAFSSESGAGELLQVVGILALVAAILVVFVPTVRDAIIAAGNRAVGAVSGLF